MPTNKIIELSEDERNALAFAVKSRLSLIEMKALAFSGQTPETFQKCLQNDWEWVALRSLYRKFFPDD